jgi:lipopolysaccharide/colanic/teichoic acid biosynthesis glycosyltransferase
MREIAEKMVALVALIILLPFLILLSVLIKSTSKGPIFFRADMLGQNGNIFKIWKLRSMLPGSKTILSAEDKTVVLPDDPRLTRFGSFLRLGFDEVPQLLNIIEGEMSFVGPRPDPSWVFPRYTSLIKNRLSVKPGLTGLAQALDGRGNSQEIIYFLDHYYVKNQSMKLDILIFALTITYIVGWHEPGKRILAGLLSGATDIDDYRLLRADRVL